MKIYTRCAVVAFAVVCLQACAVALVPMMAASVGLTALGGYKLAQTMTGGGTVEVVIEDKDVTPDQKAQLRTIRKLAVWPSPGSSSSVMFADELAMGGRFEAISPSRVSQAIRRAGASEAVNQMTNAELITLGNRICQEVGADAVILVQQEGYQSNLNMLSLQRAQIIHKGTLLVLKRAATAPALRVPVQVSVDAGGKSVDETEINKLAGKAIAKRLAELSS